MPSNDTPNRTNGKLLPRGRLQSSTNEFVQEFTTSISFDKKLYKEDITASVAHAEMLSEIGVLKKTETQKIIKGLNKIEKEIETGDFLFGQILSGRYSYAHRAPTNRNYR